jgi:arylsulfatase A-like enzyme/predicted Zn-dependent protease
LISIDTLRADRLPLYGYGKGQTPHIDALVRDSVVFESAWAHSPQTLPSHTSILTGRWPFEHGVRDNIGFVLPPDATTLATRFSDSGFSTGAFVSTYVLRRGVGLAAGFQTYDDVQAAAGVDTPLGELQRPGEQTADAAITWLQAQTADQPYFLFFHIYEPHTPYTPSVVPASGDRYDGEVTDADRIVGRLIDALRTRGDYERATIVLLSDHGEGLGDHGEDEHGLFLYRTTIQTPLIIKHPSANAGRRVATPVQHIDLAPTLIDLQGLTPDPTLRGRSLRGLLGGDTTLPAAPIYAEAMSARYHFGWSELYALTDERYRLIRAPRDELFDLQQDPGELESVHADRASVHAAMRAALDSLIAGAEVGAPSAVSDADRQRLAALGYVGSQTGSDASSSLDRPDPKDKRDVLRRYQQANALATALRWSEAADAYRALVATEPDMLDGWLRLAQAEEHAGRRPAALDAYRAVLTRDGKNAAALTGAASLLVTLGRFDEARAHAELAVDVAPAAAEELLARLAVQRGDADAARLHARRAADADPTLPMPAFIDGLILYNQGAYAASVAPLRQAAEALARRTEQVADVRYLLGDALARQEQFTEAERWFQAEIAAFPGHVRARVGVALVQLSTGRRSQAVETVVALESIGRTSSDPDAFAAAAQLWTVLGEPGRAAAARARAGR